MKLNKDYIIPFVGLKLGVHRFEFDITDTFFDDIEYSIVHKGKVKVELLLDKKETMMVGNYQINGIVEMECNRCTDPLNVEINGEYKLVYKFGTEPSDDESLIIVYPEEFELDVAENILELIMVSLPGRVVHPEGECNEEMIEILSKYIMTSENQVDIDEEEKAKALDPAPSKESYEENDDNEDIDPRWSELNKLKKR